MSVPRRPNTYGSTTSSTNGTGRTSKYRRQNGNWTTATFHNVYASATRLRPSKGQVLSDGWRLPTAWGSHAFIMTSSAYSYEYFWNGVVYEATADEGVWDGSYGTYTHQLSVQRSPANVEVNIPAGLTSSSNLKCLNKIKDSDFNAAVTLAEMNDTLAMLGKALARALRVLRAIRRGRWNEAWKYSGFAPPKGSRARTWSEHWVEYQYGWKPLVNDIYGLQQRLTDQLKTSVFTVKAQVSEPIPLSVLWKPSGSGKPGSGGGEYVSRTVYHVRVSQPTLYQLNQWGLTNPALVAWELIPFSFVVDWFLPIGSFLEGLTATLGTTFVAGFEDRIVRTDFSVAGRWGIVLSGTPMSARCRQFSFERRLKLSFEPPGFTLGTGLNFTRAANALALIQLLSRRG